MSKSYYTEEEFRAEFGISRTKSWRLRKAGTGPRWFRVGGTICYPLTEVERWVTERLNGSGDGKGRPGLRLAK